MIRAADPPGDIERSEVDLVLGGRRRGIDGVTTQRQSPWLGTIPRSGGGQKWTGVSPLRNQIADWVTRLEAPCALARAPPVARPVAGTSGRGLTRNR